MDIFGYTVQIAVIVGFVGVLLSAFIGIRTLAQQRRLAYLQSILQVSANRVRLQTLLSSVRFLVAINRLFPEGINRDRIDEIGKKESDTYDILTVNIYMRERLFTIRIQRNKHNEEMEPYEKYLYNSSWIESWRSQDSVEAFKRFLRREEPDGTLAYRQLDKFITYVQRLIIWCLEEPQFDMIFSVAPRIRRKMRALIQTSNSDPSFSEWLKIERLIFNFYRGKGW